MNKNQQTEGTGLTHTILLVDDNTANLQALRNALKPLEHKTLIAQNGPTALKIAKKAKPSLVLLDVLMPEMDGFEVCQALKADPATRESAVIFLTALDQTEDKVKGFQSGAVDFITKPFQVEEVQARVKTQLMLRSLQREQQEHNKLLASQLRIAQELLKEARHRVEGPLLGDSEAVQLLRESITRQAQNDGALLLSGPPGAGYEAVARSIHQQSGRHDSAFFHINCATIQQTQSSALLPNQLEEDSIFDLADGGTIFLERIQELPFEIQQQLGLFLEQAELKKAQGEPLSPDVRVISYANVDLYLASQQGTFITTLIPRLSHERLTLPHLIERKDDIEVIANHYLKQQAQKLGKLVDSLSEGSLRHLQEYSWPGNIEELRNLLERQVAVAQDSVLKIDKSQLEGGISMGGYRLVKKLGQGGMGEVWEARHQLLARPAAIKLLRSQAKLTPAVRQTQLRRFQKEARVTAHLKAPNTVQLFDFGMDDSGVFYYVMEHLDGLDLGQFVRQFGPLPPARLLYLIRPICRSLEEAHNHGLIHRDLKPENIFIAKQGPLFDYPKVLDFGIVKGKLEESETRLTVDENAVVGTPGYIAPEVIQKGQQQLTPSSDLYAMGCLMFFALTGREVFKPPSNQAMQLLFAHVMETPEPPSAHSPHVISPEVDALVLSCLAKQPEQRPASAYELWQTIGAITVETPWDEEQARAWWYEHLPDVANASSVSLNTSSDGGPPSTPPPAGTTP